MWARKNMTLIKTDKAMAELSSRQRTLNLKERALLLLAAQTVLLLTLAPPAAAAALRIGSDNPP